VTAWDPDVRYYVVQDRDGSLLGAFYADWFPRDNKRGGAWMDALITGGPSAMFFRTHLGVICANLTPPAGGGPTLLTLRDVETVFFMTGYVILLLLSRVGIRSLAGTNVAWDFIALPAHIMENWIWERQTLDLFARHHDTDAPMPEALFQKMKQVRTFRAANAQMRQLGFGVVDLMLHSRYSPARDGDPVEYSRKIYQEFSPAPLPSRHAAIASFTHLFGSPLGYSAGYYSYKWAEMLDADAFTRFREAGLCSADVGGQFREQILSAGDSEEAAVLFRRFMGRDPDSAAMLERLGLV
jgi:oligopeptidase A